MLERISRQAITIIISLLLIGSAIVFGISYYSLSKLAFAGDRIFYGKKQSELAQQIRQELLKRPNITSVQFKNNENMTLSGLMITRDQPKANLLVCHGFKSNKEFLYTFIDMFPNWNIFLFDFRAHGQSEGKVTSIGCHEYKDVIAAARFFKTQTEKTPHLPTILLGVSMGGASALKATEANPDICDVLITDSAYASLDKVIYRTFTERSGLPEYPFYNLVISLFHYFANCDINTMQPERSISSIKQPVLIIHSCNDALIAPSEAIKLFSNVANKDSKLWITPHCRHAWLHVYRAELYKQKVSAFVDDALKLKQKISAT